MAKIIDFKSRQVLADLPYKTTARMVKAWSQDNNYAIAMTEILAQVLIDRVGGKKQDKAS